MWIAGTSERELTILFTPGTEFLPKVGGRQVKEVTHDRVAFWAGRQAGA